MEIEPTAPSRDLLIEEHTELARRIALAIARRVPRWVDPDDLIGAALVGLAEAASRFEPGRGEPFAAYAAQRVRGAVLDELRRGDTISRRDRSNVRRLRELASRLEQQLGRAPDEHEIAASAGLEIEACRELMAGADVWTVEFDPAGESMALPVAERTSPHGKLERIELVGRLREGLDALEPRDARILIGYYEEEMTYAALGAALGITESRVCQLHARALDRLRAVLDGRPSTARSHATRRRRARPSAVYATRPR